MRAAIYRIESIRTYRCGQIPKQLSQKKDEQSEIAELAQMATKSHLYIISRRPTIKVTPRELPIFTTLRRTASGKKYEEPLMYDGFGISTHTFPPSKGTFDPNTDTLEEVFYGDYPEGISGIRFSEDSTSCQGTYKDSAITFGLWEFAVLSSRLAEGVSGQEVLYVGKSTGIDGSRTSNDRLGVHEKLQKILSNYSNKAGWEIFITLVNIATAPNVSSPQIIDLSSEIPTPENDCKASLHSRECTLRHTGSSKPSLSGGGLKDITDIASYTSVIENLLISYFKPEENVRLKSWNQKRRKYQKALTDAGIELTLLEFHSHNSLACFFSQSQPLELCHYIAGIVPGTEYSKDFPDLENWRTFNLASKSHYNDLSRLVRKIEESLNFSCERNPEEDIIFSRDPHKILSTLAHLPPPPTQSDRKIPNIDLPASPLDVDLSTHSERIISAARKIQDAETSLQSLIREAPVIPWKEIGKELNIGETEARERFSISPDHVM